MSRSHLVQWHLERLSKRLCTFALALYLSCLNFEIQCDFMVLFGTRNLTNLYGGVCRGQVNKGLNIEHPSTATLRNLFFKLCKACQLNTMASIPPSAFTAGHIRETQRESRDMKLSNTYKSGGSGKYFNTNLMELSPLKYNSKLMNSIWGLYNRYSPHNVKKVNDAHVMKAELQQ